MKKQLRAYQARDTGRLRESFRAGNKRVLYVLPTGGGKTFVFCYVAEGAANMGRVVLVTVHRKELFLQASMSLANIGLRHRLVGQDKHIREAIGNHIDELGDSFVDMNSRVIVASIQSLARRYDSIPTPNLIISDEAHHLIKGNIFGGPIDRYPEAHVLGVTATPVRGDGKGLGVHSDGYFQDLVIGPLPRELISEGYLLMPDVYAPDGRLDMVGAAIGKDGDYTEKAKEQRVMSSSIVGNSVATYARICPKMPAIAFCVSIKEAEKTAQQFRNGGFNFRSIDGTMHNTERRNLIKALAAGRIDGLTSCSIISEGTDIPVVGCGILLNPTKSEGKYLQECGRVLRPSTGQTKAYILDHVGNCFVHGLPEADREWSLEGRKKQPKGKAKEKDIEKLMRCPKCLRAFEPAAKCPHCSADQSNAFAGRTVKVEAGELAQVTGEAAAILRRSRIKEEYSAKSLKELIDIGTQRGYENPEGWAKIKFRLRAKRVPSGAKL